MVQWILMELSSNVQIRGIVISFLLNTGQILFSFNFCGESRVPTLFQEKSALEKIHSLGRNRLFKPKKKVESRLYFYL